MQIYVVVNVENLRLYELPLIEDQGYNFQIPSIEDFSPEYKTPFLTEEQGLQNEGMWITFELGSREQILQKPNASRLER